jgi:GNAT superfamily N-acetyltransferase
MALLTRTARAEDAGRLADDRVALFVESGPDLSPETLTALRAATERMIREGIATGQVRGWIATEPDGTWLGSAVVTVVRRLPTPANLAGTEAYLAQMYVVAEARRRGVGRALLDCATEDGRNAGIPVMRLRTTKAGRSLYAGYGFGDLADVMQLALGNHSADHS